MSFVRVLRATYEGTPCWFWTGARSRGSGNTLWYGSFWLPSLGYSVRAHRFSSEVLGDAAPLLPGQHRDHRCNFSLCVQPAHIEVVTHEENQRRKVRGDVRW